MTLKLRKHLNYSQYIKAGVYYLGIEKAYARIQTETAAREKSKRKVESLKAEIKRTPKNKTEKMRQDLAKEEEKVADKRAINVSELPLLKYRTRFCEHRLYDE